MTVKTKEKKKEWQGKRNARFWNRCTSTEPELLSSYAKSLPQHSVNVIASGLRLIRVWQLEDAIRREQERLREREIEKESTRDRRGNEGLMPHFPPAWKWHLPASDTLGGSRLWMTVWLAWKFTGCGTNEGSVTAQNPGTNPTRVRHSSQPWLFKKLHCNRLQICSYAKTLEPYVILSDFVSRTQIWSKSHPPQKKEEG